MSEELEMVLEDCDRFFRLQNAEKELAVNKDEVHLKNYKEAYKDYYGFYPLGI